MAKKYLFGVKYLIPFHLTTYKPLGIFEVIGGAEVSREIEQLLLEGGHNNGPYAVASGQPANGITATLKEYPDFAYELFENALVNAGQDANGYVGNLANSLGTSVFEAATGIASVVALAGSESKIPQGRLVLEAISATEVKIYLAGDISNGRIPILSELPVLEESIAITGTGGTVDLPTYGLTLTGGSGSIAMTIGDIAFVDVRPANESSTTIKVGSNADVNYFGLMLVIPRNAEGQQTIVRFPKVAAVGMSFTANTREFSEFEQAMTPLVDETEDILYEIVRTTVTS